MANTGIISQKTVVSGLTNVCKTSKEFCVPYRILKFVVGSFRLDSVLLTEGSILRDLGITWLIITGRGDSDYQVGGRTGDQLLNPLSKSKSSPLQTPQLSYPHIHLIPSPKDVSVLGVGNIMNTT